MLCDLCLYSLIRRFLQEDKRYICLLDGKEMGIRLSECDGFQREVELPVSREIEDIDNVTKHPEAIDETNRDIKLSQSDRMKEYWRKKKEK